MTDVRSKPAYQENTYTMKGKLNNSADVNAICMGERSRSTKASSRSCAANDGESPLANCGE